MRADSLNYFKCLEIEYFTLQRPTLIPLWPEQITDEMVNAAYLAHDDALCREPIRPLLEAALRAAPKQAEPVQAEPVAEPAWDPQCPLCGGARQAAFAQQAVRQREQAEPPAIFKHSTEKTQ
jgi:hypothetical protein